MAGRPTNGGRGWLGALLLACAGGATIAGELRIEPAEVDFGRRAQNQTCTAEVKIANVAAYPVTILSVASDCGCTSGQVADSRLLPGRETTLTVRFETRGGEGALRHKLFLNTQDGRETVPVSATVYRYANWRITPARAVFPPSRQGKSAEMAVEVEYLGEGKRAAGEASTNAPWLEIETSVTDPAHPEKMAYRLRKRADAPAGSLFGSLRIATKDPTAQTLEVPLFAYVSSGVTVSPNPVIWPEAQSGKSSATEVRIGGWSGKHEPRAELVGATVRMESGGKETFVLAITPASGTRKRGVESLRIYDGDRLVAEVPVIVR